MSRNQRILFLAVAVLIGAVAVVVLGSGGDDSEQSTPSAAVETATPEASPARDDAEATPEPTATPKPRLAVPTLSAENPRRLKFEQGDTIRFVVSSSVDEEIHVHGYDKSKDVRAGKKTEMSFKADITGIFEIELEHSGTPIGELEVRP